MGLGAIPAALLLAAAASAQIPVERHFQTGWAAGDHETVPPPPAAGAPVEGEEDDKHSPLTHMRLTLAGYEYFKASGRSWPDLDAHMGGISGDGPATTDDRTVVEGAHDEDKSRQNPFDELIPEMRHFWSPKGGDFDGLWAYDSAVNRAHKYMTGGYGLNGKYDEDWGKKGVRGEGALALYRRGDKAKAFWYLGHAAHLLEDMTVPAHVHLYPHPTPNSDRYETYMKKRAVPPVAPGPVETFADLRELFLSTARASEGYDCGYDGEQGQDGTADRGRRREDGFSKDELQAQASVLVPLAARRVAALFDWFRRQVEPSPAPAVVLLR